MCSGESLLAPSLTRRLIEAYLQQASSGAPPRPDGLDAAHRPRAAGPGADGSRACRTTRSPAKLVVAQATVKTHVNRVLAKLGVNTRVQAVVVAYERGLVRPGAADHFGASSANPLRGRAPVTRDLRRDPSGDPAPRRCRRTLRRAGDRPAGGAPGRLERAARPQSRCERFEAASVIRARVVTGSGERVVVIGDSYSAGPWARRPG